MILRLREIEKYQLLPGDLFAEAVAAWWRGVDLDSHRSLGLAVCANKPCRSAYRHQTVFLATLTQDDRKELHVIVHETEHED